MEEDAAPPQPRLSREEERKACAAFIQALVRCVSINDPEGRPANASLHDYDERRVVECIQAEVDQMRGGLQCRVYAKDPLRPNLVVSLCRTGPKEEEEAAGSREVDDLDNLDVVFTLMAHADTVPVGDPSLWMSPPFEGDVDTVQQVLIGRGACDNKGGIAVALYTLRRLQKSLPPQFRGKIVLAVVADEESGACSPLGLRHLLDEGVLKPCPPSPNPLRGGSIYCYCSVFSRTVTIGHRGVLRLRIEVKGKSIHTGSTVWATKRLGSNALTALCEIVTRIEAHAWPKDIHPSFPNLPLASHPP